MSGGVKKHGKVLAAVLALYMVVSVLANIGGAVQFTQNVANDLGLANGKPAATTSGVSTVTTTQTVNHNSQYPSTLVRVTMNITRILTCRNGTVSASGSCGPDG